MNPDEESVRMQCPKWPTPGKITLWSWIVLVHESIELRLKGRRDGHTSALSRSSKLRTQWTSNPSFSMALTSDRMFPETVSRRCTVLPIAIVFFFGAQLVLNWIFVRYTRS